MSSQKNTLSTFGSGALLTTLAIGMGNAFANETVEQCDKADTQCTEEAWSLYASMAFVILFTT